MSNDRLLSNKFLAAIFFIVGIFDGCSQKTNKSLASDNSKNCVEVNYEVIDKCFRANYSIYSITQMENNNERFLFIITTDSLGKVTELKDKSKKVGAETEQTEFVNCLKNSTFMICRTDQDVNTKDFVKFHNNRFTFSMYYPKTKKE